MSEHTRSFHELLHMISLNESESGKTKKGRALQASREVGARPRLASAAGRFRAQIARHCQQRSTGASALQHT